MLINFLSPQVRGYVIIRAKGLTGSGFSYKIGTIQYHLKEGSARTSRFVRYAENFSGMGKEAHRLCRSSFLFYKAGGIGHGA
jgi:hypothetical protein